MNTPDGLLTGYYYRRMHYPDEYKCSTMSITKFEKDFEIGGSRMHYLFINAFPKLVTTVPVSYGGADILRVSVSSIMIDILLIHRQVNMKDRNFMTLS